MAARGKEFSISRRNTRQTSGVKQRMIELVVSEIQIVPVKPRDGLVAFASCVINDSLYLGNIAVYTSPTNHEGYRLVYPSKILPNGKDSNCVHPINKQAGEVISRAVIQKYKDLIARMSARKRKNSMTPI